MRPLSDTLSDSPSDTLSDAAMHTLQPGQARPQSWNRPESQVELGPLPGQPSVVREPSWTGRILTFVALMGLAAALAWIVWGNRPEPGDFTLRNVMERLDRTGDRWHDVLAKKQSLTKALGSVGLERSAKKRGR